MPIKNNQPIIIIKKIKKVAGGHHGGAWKIAYADFVTAMMAFFLLMWLLNATSEEQKRGIANYFDPMSLGKMNGGGAGVMGGDAIQAKDGSLTQGSFTNFIKPSPPVEMGNGGEDRQEAGQENIKQPEILLANSELPHAGAVGADKGSGSLSPENHAEHKKREQASFKDVKEQLTKAIQNDAGLKEMLKNLVVDETEDGLRIQIMDQESKSMFPSGSAKMYDDTKSLLKKVSDAIQKIPNKISVSGHTDATRYHSDQGAYTNWELSLDRAAASRRILEEMGIPDERISSVIGKADTELFNKVDPKSPQNRRISIVLLKNVVG